jgi:hypothetical protein
VDVGVKTWCAVSIHHQGTANSKTTVSHKKYGAFSKGSTPDIRFESLVVWRWNFNCINRNLECISGFCRGIYTIKIMRTPKGILAISHVFAGFIYCVANKATVFSLLGSEMLVKFVTCGTNSVFKDTKSYSWNKKLKNCFCNFRGHTYSFKTYFGHQNCFSVSCNKVIFLGNSLCFIQE